MVIVCYLWVKYIKVIIEMGLINEDEICKLCEICNELVLDYVKIFIGFNGVGVNLEFICLFWVELKFEIKIKVFGGICMVDDVCVFIEVGVNCLGVLCGVDIVLEV